MQSQPRVHLYKFTPLQMERKIPSNHLSNYHSNCCSFVPIRCASVILVFTWIAFIIGLAFLLFSTVAIFLAFGDKQHRQVWMPLFVIAYVLAIATLCYMTHL